MAQVPTGTTFFLASAYEAAKTVTSVSNAAEAVVGVTGHGYSDGDVVEITSGWGRLNKRHARVKSSATDNFTLEGIDTSNTSFFPPGSGIGTVRKVSTFTQVVQVVGLNTSGGDPKNVPYKYFESDVEFSINDGFNAQTMTLELDADSIGTAGYTAAKTLTDVQSDTCLKTITRNGKVAFQSCTVALNESVQMQDGQINRVSLAINGTGRVVRYAS